MLDLHVHDAHFIRLVFGMPQEVTTTGRLRNNLPEFWHSQFRFADRELVVAATSGTINQQGRAFTHAFEIHLERATLMFDYAVIGEAGRYLCEPTLLDSDGQVQKPELPGGDPIDAFVSELREVTHAVRDGKASETLGAMLAQDAMRMCEAQSESLRTGQPVKLS
jgi:predicted dehydrogenase